MYCTVQPVFMNGKPGRTPWTFHGNGEKKNDTFETGLAAALHGDLVPGCFFLSWYRSSSWPPGGRRRRRLDDHNPSHSSGMISEDGGVLHVCDDRGMAIQ